MLKHLNFFRKPLASELATKAQEDYARSLFLHEAEAAFHRKMVEYYSEGIKRLQQQTTQG